jgi:hypothetical protein
MAAEQLITTKYALLLSFILILSAGSCQEKSARTYDRAEFKKYWYGGRAEINSYSLDQSRYGEQRKGSAVLIFVTEDFSKAKQVKLDNSSNSESDKVNVLKLNFIKKFTTGIYPYSMMLSVFTPVNRKAFPNTLKATMSSQEWCGHVFTQMNLRANAFDVKSFSYFEQEGDFTASLKKTVIEDELWNIIRLDYNALPTGDIDIIPGLFFSRLNHVELKNQPAVAMLSEQLNVVTYTLTLKNQERKLTIHFEKNFPYKILAWEEVFKERDTVQRTHAKLDKTLLTDYWTKNKNEFHYLRDSLNLSP